MITTDAHVHVGYYPRFGYAEPFYYSPRRIVGLMSRCGIDDFIVSSTTAQIRGITFEDIISEAHEMKRLADNKAHQFLWVSGHLFDEDPNLSVLDTGLFSGIKLHELETAWGRTRTADLAKILEHAEKRHLNVQFHCSFIKGCRPIDLKEYAQGFPKIKFDFAHCTPMNEILDVMAQCPNVYTDTSMLEDYSVICQCDENIKKRIMYGSDFPAYHRHFKLSHFSHAYRKRLHFAPHSELQMNFAFHDFLKLSN